MVTVFTTLVVSLLELAKIMVLEESEYMRDLLLAYFRYRERPRREGVNPQEQRDRAAGGDHTLPRSLPQVGPAVG